MSYTSQSKEQSSTSNVHFESTKEKEIADSLIAQILATLQKRVNQQSKTTSNNINEEILLDKNMIYFQTLKKYSFNTPSKINGSTLWIALLDKILTQLQNEQTTPKNK